jgi:hypothetical protein
MSAWPGQRGDESLPNHVVRAPDYWNRFRRLLCSANCHTTTGINDIDLGFN